MVKGFSRVQVGLHWAVVVLILFNLLVDNDMGRLMRDAAQGGTAATSTLAWAHIIVASLVLVLVAWRLALRLTRGVPAAPEGESALLKLAGAAGHVALYLLMIALPVTGLLGWYGGMSLLAEQHGGILKVLLWLVIMTHALAALYHHFVLKDGLLDRMRKPTD